MVDDALGRFLEEGLSLHVGACDATLRPAGARAIAVRFEPDGTHLWVYIPAVAAERLRPSFDATRQITVSAARPSDDRACQVKGVVVEIRPATEDEHATVAGQWDGFMRQLEFIGVPRQMASSWTTWPAAAVRM
jgi:hypothetical protein